MKLFNKIKSKLKNISKYELTFILILVILATTISISTLARYKHRINIENILSSVDNWDGSVASSYHKGVGSKDNPFIISNASEFAYFAEQLKVTDYSDTYFKLSNNIVINNGVFDYSNDKLSYKLSNSVFYLKEFTTDLYEKSDYSDEKVGSINSFSSINNFNGYLDGDYYTIYGLYVYNESGENALFNKISGSVENIYIENSVVYGGSKVAMLASVVEGASIKNIYTSGYVIGTNVGNDSIVLNLDDYNKDKTGVVNDIISVNLPSYLSSYVITSVNLKGIYSSSVDNQNIIINGEEVVNGRFDINLGAEVLDKVEISISDDIESTISITDLVYEVNYEYGGASGVVGKALNSDIINVINKANIYSVSDAAGIIGIMSNSNLSSSYNTAIITGISSSGIVSKIVNSTSDVNISKVYNSGELSSNNRYSFIKEIVNNEKVIFENSFNVSSSDYSVFLLDDELVLNNVLDVTNTGIKDGTTSDMFIEVERDALTVKDYLVSSLGFYEFIDSDDLAVNSDNIWVYEKSSLPILYFDDLNKAIATLYAGTYTWNELGYELSDIYFSDSIMFSIEEVDSLNPIKESYYYLSKDGALTKEEIENITEWTKYEGVTSLSDEGRYVIYVKVVDQDDNITYMNSERLVLDLSGPTVKLSVGDISWNSFKTELSTINIVEDKVLMLDVSDNYSLVKSVEYYISNDFVSNDDLKALSSDNWVLYEDNISISEQGFYVINIRALDERGHVTYINSDYIMYKGFYSKVYIGRNEEESVLDINITDRSVFSYNFIYESKISYLDGYNNNLITNVLLPKGTVMTLIDNVNNEVYSYSISSNDDLYNYENSCSDESCNKYATYPLSLFEKIGQVSGEMFFSDEEFLSNDEKNLTLVVDFSKAVIDSDFTLISYLQLNDGDDDVRLSTLKDTLKKVNVYNDLEYDLSISKVNEVDVITYNSNSSNNLVFDVNVNYPELVNDTILEDKKIGIAVKLVDSWNVVVSKKYLKNIEFKLGDKTYFPNSDGITRIDLSNISLDDVNFSIITHESNLDLSEGNYSFVISPYVSYDGVYTTDMNHDSVSYPVVVNEVKSYEYGFNVLVDDFKILKKEDGNITVDFNVVNSNSLDNPSVRVSLYKKKLLTAYDQTYELIDLKDYVSNELVSVEDSIYLVSSNKLGLSIDLTKLEKIGYELRFELYDGSDKVTTVKKKFIVK